MAANVNLKGINWNEIAEEVGEGGRKSSGMVAIIDQAAREIMSDGKPYTVNKIKNMIDLGLNKDLPEGEAKFDVNWSTVKHTLQKHDGFKQVGEDGNTFVLDSAVKKNHGRKKVGKR